MMRNFINNIGLGSIIAILWLGIIPFCIWLCYGLYHDLFKEKADSHTVFGVLYIAYMIVGIFLAIIGAIILIGLIGVGIEELNKRKL